jgi:hypothetical protein
MIDLSTEHLDEDGALLLIGRCMLRLAAMCIAKQQNINGMPVEYQAPDQRSAPCSSTSPAKDLSPASA